MNLCEILYSIVIICILIVIACKLLVYLQENLLTNKKKIPFQETYNSVKNVFPQKILDTWHTVHPHHPGFKQK